MPAQNLACPELTQRSTVHKHTHMHTQVFTYMPKMYFHTYIHTYIHRHTQTHTHGHTHTDTQTHTKPTELLCFTCTSLGKQKSLVLLVTLTDVLEVDVNLQTRLVVCKQYSV